MHVGHGPRTTRTGGIGSAERQMVGNHARCQNVEGDISALDRIVGVVVAGAPGPAFRAGILNAQLPHIDILPAKTGTAVGAQLPRHQTVVADRLHATIVDALVVKRKRQGRARIPRHAHGIVFRNIELSALGKQTGIAIKAAHADLAGVRRPQGETG